MTEAARNTDETLATLASIRAKAKPDARMRREVYNFPVENRWYTFEDRVLESLKNEKRTHYNWICDRIISVQKNPLAWFKPHGMKWTPGRRVFAGGRVVFPKPTYPEEYGNDGVGFLNDWESDVIMLVSGRKCGKTSHGAVKTGLFCCATDPEWPIFTEHGVIHRPFYGPKILAVASFSWQNVNDLWNVYKEFLPRSELGPYSPMWGHFRGEKGKPARISFEAFRTRQIRLECSQSEFYFLCYTQRQHSWESFRSHGMHADEQIKENLMVAWRDGTRTMGDYTPVWMTLTGFVLEDRPDTGAAGYVKRNYWDVDPEGVKVGRYGLSVESTPNCVISAKTKLELKNEVLDRRRVLTEKLRRRLEATYYGGWETGGGLVIESWMRPVHVIADFDLKPFHPTWYRMIDHGQNPCAAVLFAVMPWGDAIAAKEYYAFGRNIPQNARGIVEELCGNTIRRVGDTEDISGITWPVYEEIRKTTDFVSSEIDARSFGKKADTATIKVGTMYNRCGCECKPSSGSHVMQLVPLLRQWMALDPRNKHINRRLKRNMEDYTVEMGAPKLYVFASCRNLIAEIEKWVMETKTEKPKARDKDDHLMSCMLFFAAKERLYYGDSPSREMVSDVDNFRPNVDPFTGY